MIFSLTKQNRDKGSHQKIRNLFRSREKDAVVESLLHHFKEIGVKVKPVQSNSLRASKSGFNLLLRCRGCLKCEGRNIDLIRIFSVGYSHYKRYSLHYLFNARAKGLQEYLKTNMEEVNVGLGKRFESIQGKRFEKIKGVSWVGGQLAYELNHDPTLNNHIKIRGLRIEAEREGDFVMIITPGKKHITSLFPTAEEVNTYERIGTHIHNVISYFS
jgi:hypothetical protein